MRSSSLPSRPLVRFVLQRPCCLQTMRARLVQGYPPSAEHEGKISHAAGEMVSRVSFKTGAANHMSKTEALLPALLPNIDLTSPLSSVYCQPSSVSLPLSAFLRTPVPCKTTDNIRKIYRKGSRIDGISLRRYPVEAASWLFNPRTSCSTNFKNTPRLGGNPVPDSQPGQLTSVNYSLLLGQA